MCCQAFFSVTDRNIQATFCSQCQSQVSLESWPDLILNLWPHLFQVQKCSRDQLLTNARSSQTQQSLTPVPSPPDPQMPFLFCKHADPLMASCFPVPAPLLLLPCLHGFPQDWIIVVEEEKECVRAGLPSPPASLPACCSLTLACRQRCMR